MISVNEAQSIIFEAVANLRICKTKIVSLENSRGLILSSDVYGERHQPPFHRVAMDGMAINFDNFQKNQNRKFKIEGIAKAGSPTLRLQDASNAIEVMTGCPLPEGCDCVIRYEDLVEERECLNNDEVVFQTVMDSVDLFSFKNIHKLGSDYKKGDLVLKGGQIIDSTIMAILASQGLQEVSVKTLPKIAIISTGDELIDPGHTILDHQIRRSNPYAIKSEIENFSNNVEVNLFHLKDEPNEIEKSLKEILADYKLIILSGGVSKGKFDFVPETLKSLGSVELFHKVKQRPGKPLWFGKGSDDQIIFALPGNPVSSLINARRYIVPVLDFLLNEKHTNPLKIKLSDDFKFSPNLSCFLPVKLEVVDGTIHGAPVIGNGSGDFSALAVSEGFIELPLGSSIYKSGELFDFYKWSGKGELL